MRYAIVTDSTCDLPEEELARLQVDVVPLRFLIGGHVYTEGVDMDREQFYDRMDTDPQLPTTSQPSPADFQTAYQRLADEGYQEIISIHLSGRLSGTVETARLCARSAPIPVLVVDSRTTVMGLGFQVRELASLRAQGVFPSDAVARVHLLRDHQQLFFMPRNLDALIKGGRIGRAQGAAAGFLDIKVLISVDAEGGAFVAAKAKGSRKALKIIVDTARAMDLENGPLKVSYIHVRNIEGAHELKRMFEAAGIHVESDEFRSVSPVIAVHSGIGAIGAVFQPAGIGSAKT